MQRHLHQPIWKRIIEQEYDKQDKRLLRPSTKCTKNEGRKTCCREEAVMSLAGVVVGLVSVVSHMKALRKQSLLHIPLIRRCVPPMNNGGSYSIRQNTRSPSACYTRRTRLKKTIQQRRKTCTTYRQDDSVSGWIGRDNCPLVLIMISLNQLDQNKWVQLFGLLRFYIVGHFTGLWKSQCYSPEG